MGLMTGLATIVTVLQVTLAVAAVVIAGGFAVLAVDVVRTQRPRRLARHESIGAWYLKGHAFSH
jgi:hypothetical protein